jgi:hypothetical protein
MTGDKDFQLGLSDENGDFLPFSEVAKQLPDSYSCVDQNGLPPLDQRAVISKELSFYDLFQVIEVLEDETSQKFKPDNPGWYWVTYFADPSTGCAHVGPFSSDREALDHAAAHALPINDPRREHHRAGFIGEDILACCVIGTPSE